MPKKGNKSLLSAAPLLELLWADRGFNADQCRLGAQPSSVGFPGADRESHKKKAPLLEGPYQAAHAWNWIRIAVTEPLRRHPGRNEVR